MNDPLKEFVQQNREAFDHLEPPADVLQRVRAQIVRTPVVRQRFFQHRRAAWLVAASLLAGMVCTYLVFNHSPTAPYPNEPRLAQQPLTEVPAAETPTVERRVETQQVAKAEQPQMEAARQVRAQPEPMPKPLATRLADSSSASIRLAAILEIEQLGRMDDQLRSMLSESMNHDDNTNVRLAALDVLSRHLQDPQVADLLATSLTNQDDPLVQLGIVKVSAQLNHVGIEEALFAVARNPYTFMAVKDEAYAVLLHQEKL